MLRILTLLATVATAATLSGGANAHPPDISARYGTSYHAPHYAQPTYAQPRYSQPVYSQPRYSQPSYVRPSYDAAPLYSRTYATPAYRRTARHVPEYTTPVYAPAAYAPPRVSSYAGYSSPGYGYRHRRGHSQPVRVRTWSNGTDIGRIQRAPMTESVTYGYRGGPTYGNDFDAVINGVRIYGTRD